MDWLMVEHNGARYFHFSVVVALVVLLVFNCFGLASMFSRNRQLEGLTSKIWRGSYNQTSAHPDMLSQEQGFFQTSASGRADMPGVLVEDALPVYGRERFLGGPEPVIVQSPPQLAGHQYMKKVHDAASVDESFHGQGTSAKPGVSEWDLQNALGGN